MVQSLVLLVDFDQLGHSVLTGGSSQLLHGLQQGLVVFLQLQQAAGGQLIHLLTQRLLRG